jgi:hypothetical protein
MRQDTPTPTQSTPNGQRFLIPQIREHRTPASGERTSATIFNRAVLTIIADRRGPALRGWKTPPTPITVVLDWTATLKK